MVKKLFCTLGLMLISTLIYVDVAPAEIKADWGGSFRLRWEYFENVIDFETISKTDRDRFRLRTWLWGKVDFNENFGIYGLIANEAYYYLGNYKPFEIAAPKPGYLTSDSDRFDEDELVIGNLYFDVRKLFGLPIDIRIGRQDFLGQYGEGFLISDGTPGDSSRTFYFDAIKANWKIHANHSIDLAYVNNHQTDSLPTLHPARSDYLAGYYKNEKVVNISDEWGVILYGRSKLTSNLTVEPYYIFKHEDSVGTDYKATRASAGGPTDPLDLNTVGARVVFTAGNWTIRGEYAHQFGEYDSGKDREADGGYLFVSQKFPEVALKPEWELGFVFLSGDDPDTTDHEGWDPLWSRVPYWNEILAYTLTYETLADSGAIPGYWTNLQIAKLGLKVALTVHTKLALSYQHLWADEETNITGPRDAMFSNDPGDRDRGDIVTAVLSHTFTKQLDGLLQFEYFAPGDFYENNAEDAIFLRGQLTFKF